MFNVMASEMDSENLIKTLPVTGMHCASCALRVEKTLKEQSGVLSAAVNLANASARIEFTPGKVTLDDLQKSIRTIGFDLLITQEESSASHLEEINREYLRQLKTGIMGAMLFTLPTVMIGMFFMQIPYANYILWVLSTPVIFLFGRNFYLNAWKQARLRTANMDTLVALSTGVAYVFSVFNTLFPAFWEARGIHAHVYFEAAAVVITFILLGRFLEEKAKTKTNTAIKKLMGLQPEEVNKIENGISVKVPIAEVKPGDILLARPGEKIAVDGVVLSGSSFVNESMMNGEAVAVHKKEGNPVFAGTLNQKGSFQYTAQKIGKDTLLAQIIQRVEEAQGSKAPVQKLADRVAAVFVPVVILIALLSFFLWYLLGGDNGLTYGIMSLVTVLVIACPCALGLATPTAIMVGLGKGAEQGILIKDAEALEMAHKVNTLVLDKTGTLTEGNPVVTDCIWSEENVSDKNLLLSIEIISEHPLAEAIVKYFPEQKEVSVENFENIPGKGVRAMFGGNTYWVGNKRLIEENHISIPAAFTEKEMQWEKEAKTVLWFVGRKSILALIAVTDPLKKTSAEAVRQIQNMGIEVHMLTGDHPKTAEAMALQTGITHFRAEMLPAAKEEYIKALQADGKIVAMAGDGINDSAALARADVSIAMGHGSDIAMDTAKITLISSDLLKIAAAIKLSVQTVRAVRQNLFWAFIYNLTGIPIAAGVLYPLNGFLLNPMIAGAAMALSSVSVVTNSLRLKWMK